MKTNNKLKVVSHTNTILCSRLCSKSLFISQHNATWSDIKYLIMVSNWMFSSLVKFHLLWKHVDLVDFSSFYYYIRIGGVQRWKVFLHISELFILVPALLGLKGNLDMCLASRLSTQANLGRMTSRSDVIHMVVGNIALVQVQATVAGNKR